MLKGKKILIGVTGSIAAYKTATLIRLLVKQGATVKVMMTPGAEQFITPLTLSTLSGNPVLMHLSDNDSWANHVLLGRWADLFIIAPLSCNTLAKMANGICDNLLMAVYLSATCKVMIAPAMDEDMWNHPATRMNMQRMDEYGHHILPVAYGSLASGLTGNGRMAEPDAIVDEAQRFFFRTQDLVNQRVLITAGPTYEPIDPVRFIGNHSSGMMGFALASAARDRGAHVTLVTGPVQLPDITGVDMVRVQTADQMYEACHRVFPETDIAILAAAVADYKVAEPAPEKIKKKDDTLSLDLVKNKDILQSLGAIKTKQIVVGFALETNNEEANALKKLEAKNADFIVLNSLRDAGAGFGSATNKITLFSRDGKRFQFDLKSKQAVAEDILNTILSHEKH
ncbi:MAG TPA: bifunctional phosphopantothenoylcysteine decarboxylase/phosphopantothenate--cysteine ligase CoaBC [Ferruginibacter sp.]|nr:bifunctional phosphopantothenoylcysteine decarboxylase/phosphopantothenate--cysteine ligase CoaBC [Ferruginibacter sp.]HRO17141.1 bifunctional phosphopantothenoylcysteine decarboxylase/phosphopantothenate--cysteine ligase CoaBC [Ferruginibacter sp.]HRQ21208.1 bifunctional phosphopantothenoylcysteine decarboxylase/phosphopantothenate--cysteine ligase CoaBC [Ferruginibacter sp.]